LYAVDLANLALGGADAPGRAGLVQCPG
jgi:hypothetical protein